MRSLAFSAVLLMAAAPLFAQDTTTAKPAALAWGPAPAIFPSGAQMAVVSGDPGKAAPFVVALKMPAGYRIPPHFHPTDETVEVKEGLFLVGMGDTLDLEQDETDEGRRQGQHSGPDAPLRDRQRGNDRHGERHGTFRDDLRESEGRSDEAGNQPVIPALILTALVTPLI